jgi:hypothetical protein
LLLQYQRIIITFQGILTGILGIPFYSRKVHGRLYGLACPQAYSFGAEGHRAGRVGNIRKYIMPFNDLGVFETGSAQGI